jgi:hypothetical protein
MHIDDLWKLLKPLAPPSSTTQPVATATFCWRIFSAKPATFAQPTASKLEPQFHANL